MRTYFFLVLLSSGGFGSISCVEPKSQPTTPSTNRVRVQVGSPQRLDLMRTIELVTHLQPYQEVMLYARVNGYLQTIQVDRGSRVKQGQLLAEIAVPELQRELKQAEAQFQAGVAQVQHAKAELALRQVVYQRLLTLWQKAPGATSRLRVEEAKGHLAIAQAHIAVAQARISVHRTKIERLRTLIRLAKLRAPFDGVVTDRYVHPGALILGDSKTQPILSLVQTDRLRGVLDIPAPDAPFARHKQALQIYLDERRHASPISATISRIAEALHRTSRTLRVEYDLTNSPNTLYPGMYGRAVLALESRNQTLTVPSSWILEQKQNHFVFLVKQRRLQRIPVTLGVTQLHGGQLVVEILRGLQGQEQVVQKPTGTMLSGLEVEVLP